MTPPSLETAREILAGAAAKARSGGDAFAEIAAAAIDVVLAELDRRGPRVVPFHDSEGRKIGDATVDGCMIVGKISDEHAAAMLRASVGPRGVSLGYRVDATGQAGDALVDDWNRRPQRSADPAPAGPAGGDHAGGAESSRPAAADPCMRRSALALLEAAKEIRSEIERVVNGWEGHDQGDVTERVRATLECWSDRERAAALGVLLDPRPPERGTRARITGELAQWMSASDGKLELTTEEVRAAGLEIVERRAADAGADLAAVSTPHAAGPGATSQRVNHDGGREGRDPTAPPIDIKTVRVIARGMGYGRMMQLAEELWRNAAGDGSELTVGPCAGLLVPCVCARGDRGERCGWCEGTQRVTQRVRNAIEAMNVDRSRTSVDLDELERKAIGAEQSEWRRGQDPYSDQVYDVNSRRVCDAVWPGNAAHIAANSPPVTLALIARIRELQDLGESLVSEIASKMPGCDDVNAETAILEKGAVLP